MPRLRFLLCAVILLLAALPVGAVIVRVDAGASGANDGTSWADAFTTIQAEIDSSKPRFSILTDHIAVTPFGAQVASVVSLKENVKIYGGFAGTETDLSDRNPANNLTIIDGQGARCCLTRP